SFGSDWMSGCNSMRPSSRPLRRRRLVVAVADVVVAVHARARAVHQLQSLFDATPHAVRTLVARGDALERLPARGAARRRMVGHVGTEGLVGIDDAVAAQDLAAVGNVVLLHAAKA